MLTMASLRSRVAAQWGHWPTSDVVIHVKLTQGSASPFATYPGHSPNLEAASPAWKAMLDPTWQHRQQQPPPPPLKQAEEAGQQQQQQQQQEPAESEPVQEVASHAAEASKRCPPPEPACPSKRPRVNSQEHPASTLLATKPTPRLGLELLCDSQEEAEAAEQLLRHVYCLPLPACPAMLVRMLLLANKYQVELGELVDSLWSAQYDMEALKLLEEAAQLEVPRDITRVLQKELLQGIAESVPEWRQLAARLDLCLCLEDHRLSDCLLELPVNRLEVAVGCTGRTPCEREKAAVETCAAMYLAQATTQEGLLAKLLLVTAWVGALVPAMVEQLMTKKVGYEELKALGACLKPGACCPMMKLLQSQLLDILSAATSPEVWQEASAEGLDLEYCLHTPQLRARLQACSAPKLQIILADNATKVASEGTCLALVMSGMPAPQHRDYEEWHSLLSLIRWRWLPSSSIWYAAKGGWFPRDVVRLLPLVALIDERLRGRVLLEKSAPGSIMYPSALLPRRPASRMTELELTWEVSMEDLRGSFGTTAALIPAPGKHCFSGFQWSCRLSWGKDAADPTLWVLSVDVDANAASGVEPPEGCMLSMCSTLYVNGTLVGEPTWSTCWDCNAETRSMPLLKVSMWPASGIAHFGLVGEVLRGKVVVHKVL